MAPRGPEMVDGTRELCYKRERSDKGDMTMFAILETGGKQYKVAEGDILEVELLPEELVKKNTISLSTVLLIQGEKDLLIGDPYVKNAKVKAKVLEEIKADKIRIFKFKAKKGYQKSQGHRQKLHRIQIEKIEIKASAKTKETE
jgi:large subunit ribosomal protein L21